MQQTVLNAHRSHALEATWRSLLIVLVLAVAFVALMLAMRQVSDARLDGSTANGVSEISHLPTPPIVQGRPF